MWSWDPAGVPVLWSITHITLSRSRYEVKLHPGRLTLVPLGGRGPAHGEAASQSPPISVVIHLSDGAAGVRKPHSPDAFTLVTHKNEYQ